MKNKIIAFIITVGSLTGTLTTHAETQPGIGTRQTQGTVKGILGGGLLGGILGHQYGKQKEGVILGTIVGGIIGNQSGKNSDYRRSHDAQQQSARERYYHRRQQSSTNQRSSSYTRRPTGYNSSTGGDLYNDPEIVAAKQRAERAERELQRRREIEAREIEKQRLLQEYQARAEQANHNLRY